MMNIVKDYISNSPIDTVNFAKLLACEVGIDVILLLHGEVGAGKTTFSKGFLSNYNLGKITSPTFNIINDYSDENGLLFYHIDLYRISNFKEVLNLNITEILDISPSVILIEWFDLILPLLFNNMLSIKKIYRVDLKKVDEKQLVESDDYFATNISVYQIDSF